MGLVVFNPSAVLGCPFCSSDVGLQVRAAVFGADFVMNVATISLPFLMLAALVAWLFHDSSIPIKPICGENHDE